MNIVKKMKLKLDDINALRTELEDYIWVLLDLRRGMIAAGDENMYSLRDILLMQRSLPEDIYGLGLDMNTGEVTLSNHINRCNPFVREHGSILPEDEEKIRSTILYFFANLPVYNQGKKRPQGS